MPLDGGALPPVAQVLIRVREHLERGWCRDTQAMTVDGVHVSGEDPSAVAWCLYGAIFAATPPSPMSIADEATLIAVVKAITAALPSGNGLGGISVFNDAQTTVEPVLAVVDRALESVLK